MNPELLALARAYMALPGAPGMAGGSLSYVMGGRYQHRTFDGMLWEYVAHPAGMFGEWLPDLTNAATGGVMLDLLPFHVIPTRRDRPRVYGLVYVGLDERRHTTGLRATLAEAVARVAVALGRAG